MKRMNRAVKRTVRGTTALCMTFALTTVAPASAVDTPANNDAALYEAALELADAASADAADADTEGQSSKGQGGWDIALDPALIKELIEAFRPPADTPEVTKQTGRDASGNTVSSPTTGTFTSVYGERWGTMHNGIDIGNAVGTPIYSVMDGEVISSGPAQGFGNWIRVRHDDGAISVYGHMPANMLYVSVGDRVSAGQEIAGMGSEGHSTGPHLHFEIRPDGTTPVDPVPWFKERGITI